MNCTDLSGVHILLTDLHNRDSPLKCLFEDFIVVLIHQPPLLVTGAAQHRSSTLAPNTTRLGGWGHLRMAGGRLGWTDRSG